MSKHIVIDPITRIEGHLRIEAVINDKNVITDAFSSSTLFRGIEEILKGRDPRDCGLLAMRICGVCTGTHYQRSIEAVEDAFKITIPKNARLVRNLMQGALYIHDHIVHFYHLHALDWVDITKALDADPKKAVTEAQKWGKVAGNGSWNANEDNYKRVQDRVTKYIKQGRLGIFGNAYWGSSAYKLNPEQNLIALSHYLDALDMQREIAKAQAIYGGKNPHPQSIVVGGVTCVQDIKNPARNAQFKQIIQKARKFVLEAYLPDIYMAGTVYAQDGLDGIGAGLGNFMTFGDFNLDDTSFYGAKKLFPRGIVKNKDLSKVYEVDQAKITEDVTHAWYEGTDNLHPFDGKSKPDYTGFKKKENNIAYLDTDKKYSWIKSPLYNDERMELGPLARMVVGFASKDERITKYVSKFLKNSSLPASVLFSTIGRTAARAIETELMCDMVLQWSDELATNAARGDLSTWTDFDFETVSKDCKGYGMAEAPRGALGHWIKIKDGRVTNYQAVVPSTWNAAPRDYKGRMGAYESSLIGTKVANVDQPLEILRTIHSFDPCIACAVHIIDTKGKELGVYKIDPAKACRV